MFESRSAPYSPMASRFSANLTLIGTTPVRFASERFSRAPLLAFALFTTARLLGAQAPGEYAATKPIVPAWAQPGSATHVQVPPPSDFLAGVSAKLIGIEKHGHSIALFISLEGEPMHQFGPPMSVHFDEPFYVGIGFCSHLPDTLDTAVISDVLENSAGKVR